MVIGESAGALARRAEALGESRGVYAAAELQRMLAHKSPLVREGAVCGAYYARCARISGIVRLMATDDPSPGVRQTASDVVEEWDEATEALREILAP